MRKTINRIAAVATIGFGMIGWLAPSYTMEVLDLSTTDGSTLGMSEIRAASGALFVGLGAAALWLNRSVAFMVVGGAYAGAAVGRATSILFDDSGALVSWGFLLVEIILAAWFLLANSKKVGTQR